MYGTQFLMAEKAVDALKNYIFDVSQANWENTMTIGLSLWKRKRFS